MKQAQSSCLGNHWPGTSDSRPVILTAMPVTPIGRCASCRHQKRIRSGRGSEFSMCLRHRQDAAYPKYPRLPVLRCSGYEPRPGPAAVSEDRAPNR